MLLVHHWWLLALRGISSVIFGIYFFFYPDLTLELLFRGFCLYAFADGAFCIVAAALSGKRKQGLILLAAGLISISAGAITLYQPVAASFALLLSVGVWAAFTGIIEIAAGYILTGELKGIGWLKTIGAISLILGFYIISQPFIGFPSLAILIGIFQQLRGIINVMISLSIRFNRNNLETQIKFLN
jgi:uncharacterized membrane protein HdeD (DUF308 family)